MIVEGRDGILKPKSKRRTFRTGNSRRSNTLARDPWKSRASSLRRKWLISRLIEMFFLFSTAKSSSQRLVEQRLFVLAVGEFQGFRMGGGSHFGPRFAQRVDDFVVGGLAGEIGELILQ